LQESVGGLPITVRLDATASGRLSGRMAWDGALGRPAWSTSQATLQVAIQPHLVGPQAVPGVGAIMRGRLDLLRHAWTLPGAETLAITDTKALLGILAATPVRIDGKERSWKDLAAEANPVFAQVAAGVLHACSTGLRIESTQAPPPPAQREF
jgi:hypothetical protein